MEHHNPVKEARFIKEEYLEYVQSLFKLKETSFYSQIFRKELAEFDLVKGPFLTIDLPYASDQTIKQMIALGKMDPDFAKCADVIKDPNRHLYRHQARSIERVEAGHSVVITTGTSSGKTECFLYPILDSILKEKRSGDREKGIRAILLFPMNALVSDQMERLRSLLKNYPDITFASYTGETPENAKDKNRTKGMTVSGLSNELNYREQIRENPPDILFTNYSMLEYLLLRPNDSKITDPEAMKHWRFLVLDEAHTYKGALGIEVAYLLRRLQGATKRKPQFILASATLGHGPSDCDKIIDFAHSLTGADYISDDIIFAERDAIVPEQFDLIVDPKDYSGLVEKSDNPKAADAILEKYLQIPAALPFDQKLYSLLSRDRNVYFLYSENHKADSAKEFASLAKAMIARGIQEDELIDLVELISQAVNDFGKPIYSVKYHMFMRSPDGAFVTLNPTPDLRLIKSNTIGGLKAFTMAICENCGSAYLMGHIIDGVLEQVDEMDLMDENIDQADFIDYFLLKDLCDPMDYESAKKDSDNIEYAICAKCGHVCEIGDHNAEKCSCGDQYLNYALKVPSTSKANYCPVCNHDGDSVVGFHIGKDRATAILAQNILRVMGPNGKADALPAAQVDGSGFFGISAPKAKEADMRQFIAFNDSRQQAAFFALFFDHNEQHAQMKAMLRQLLEDNGNQPLCVSTLHQRASDFYLKNFTKEKLNPSAYLTPNDRAWLAVLYELTRQEGNYSGENIGLYAFVLDLPTIYDDPKLLQALQANGFVNISIQQFKDLTRQVLDLFRTVPALLYPALGLDPKQLSSYLQYRRFRNAIKLQGAMGDPKDCRSLLPITYKGRTVPNKTLDYVMRAFSLDASRAKELVTLVWQLALKSGILQSYPDEGIEYRDAYVIDVSHYSLHAKQDLSFYRCNLCRHVSVYDINDVCTSGKCSGKLEKIDPDAAFKDNYYRKNYLSKNASDEIVIYEHDAQLSPQEARRYQKGFNDRQINVLSCSTTFEMGVNIDKLSTVFMRNVPPSPSNYAQRAGRAGRSAKTSAFVLTYCGSNSHDYTWYSDPLRMISGLVDPPHFELTNEKILMRHVMASVLRFYFHQHISEFENVSAFLDDGGPAKVEVFIAQKPQSVEDYLVNYVFTDPEIVRTYGNFRWVDFLLNKTGTTTRLPLMLAMDGLTNELAQYNAAKAQANAKNDTTLYNYYDSRIKDIKSEGIPEAFSRLNVIPRYGFPVDTVKLTVFNPLTGKEDKNHRLERDLSIAISEYAPDSQVVVDKRTYTSRYITLPKHGFGIVGQSLEKEYYFQCECCGRINLSQQPFPDSPVCEYCHKPNPIYKKDRFYIVPALGFVAETENSHETERLKPVKTYAGEIYHLGGGKQINQIVQLGQALKITTSEDDQLLVMNTSPFFYCPSCGYAVLDKEATTNTINRRHKRDNFSGTDCDNTQLIRTSLGHRYSTDVVTLTIGIPLDKSSALSTLYALLEGISKAFDIERRDINGVVESDSSGSYSTFILFDTVPGGAGHVKRICTADGMMKALNDALWKVSQGCCGEDTSCYECLRNYDNQRYHKDLVRGLAKKVLETLIKLAGVPSIALVDAIDSDKSNVAPVTWDGISGIYLDQTAAETMIKAAIPLPEYCTTILKDDRHLPAIGPQCLSWPKFNVLILFDQTPDSAVDECKKLGWHVYRMSSIDYQQLKEVLK